MDRFKCPFGEVLCSWDKRHDHSSMFRPHCLTCFSGVRIALIDDEGVIKNIMDVLGQYGANV